MLHLDWCVFVRSYFDTCSPWHALVLSCKYWLLLLNSLYQTLCSWRSDKRVLNILFKIGIYLKISSLSEIKHRQSWYLTLGAENCQIFLNRYTGLLCSSTVSLIKHDQAMLCRHFIEGNLLCQQPSDDCLIAMMSFLAKNRGLGGAYSVFGPICPPPLPMLSPSLNSHWTKRTRVA